MISQIAIRTRTPKIYWYYDRGIRSERHSAIENGRTNGTGSETERNSRPAFSQESEGRRRSRNFPNPPPPKAGRFRGRNRMRPPGTSCPRKGGSCSGRQSQSGNTMEHSRHLTPVRSTACRIIRNRLYRSRPPCSLGCVWVKTRSSTSIPRLPEDGDSAG